MLGNFKKLSEQNLQWETKRQKQNLDWFDNLIKELILAKIHADQKTNKRYADLTEQIKNKKTTSIEAAHEIAKTLSGH